MKCHACAAALPDDAAFCSACGTRLTEASADTAGEREVALAEANVYRLRGMYAEAERRCVDVLRADPNNVHAHSLIGDIYFDQGRFEDARLWYQLALDLDPNSRPDREKLGRVTQILAAKTGSARDEQATIMGIPSPAVVRWLAVVLAVCFLGALAAVVTHRPRRTAEAGSVAPARTEAAPQQPVASAGQRAPALAPSARAQTPLLEPGIADEEPSEEQDTGAREAQLEQLLSTAPWYAGADTGRAVVLSEDARLALVLVHSVFPEALPAEDDMATKLVRACLIVLQAEPEVRTVEVVVRAAAPGVPYHNLLRAKASRSRLVQNTAPASGQQARALFSTWQWTPQQPQFP